MSAPTKECFNYANISEESVKIIAEASGIANISDEIAKLLAEHVTYQLKIIIQDARKFQGHARRKELCGTDFDSALKVKNIEPLYGFTSREFIPFRFSSGRGKDIYFTEEKELELMNVVRNQMPKLPLDVTVRAHWLSIEGVQPAIRENPPPVTKEEQKCSSLVPPAKLIKTEPFTKNKDSKDKLSLTFHSSLQNDWFTHELSIEQQMYYRAITEACVSKNEIQRVEAIQSITCDPGLYQMLPMLSHFIYEGVRVSIVQNDMAMIIYLLRMVQALLDNPTLYMEKYLHEIIPSVITCIVSRRLSTQPDSDHWTLREFASRIIARISKTFNTTSSNITARIIRMFNKALINDKLPLASHYGAISALSELGPETVRIFVIPRVKDIAERVKVLVEEPVATIDKRAAIKTQELILKVLPPVLRSSNLIDDNLEDYKTKFGYLGTQLHCHVMRLKLNKTVIQMPSSSVVQSQPRVIFRTPTLVAMPRSNTEPNNLVSNSATGHKFISITTPSSSATTYATIPSSVVTTRASMPFSSATTHATAPTSLVKIFASTPSSAVTTCPTMPYKVVATSAKPASVATICAAAPSSTATIRPTIPYKVVATSAITPSSLFTTRASMPASATSSASPQQLIKVGNTAPPAVGRSQLTNMTNLVVLQASASNELRPKPT